jgi:hypothetical protein
MYGSELRTYGLGAVVAVLLGASTGVGWHYFSDGADGSAVIPVATSLTQQDVSHPSLACPPSRGGPVAEAPRLPVLSHPNNQPDTTHVRDALRVAHAAHARRARQVTPSGQPDGGERNAL